MALLIIYCAGFAAAGSTSAILVPPARSYKDAVTKAAESFAIVGPIAFGWSAMPLFFARQPAMALSAGLQSVQRWGGTSVGFSGGRAISQVIRQTDDDVWCAAAGGLAAAILGSPSIELVPARVCGFVGLSILLETQLVPLIKERTAAQPVRSKPNPVPQSQRTSPPVPGALKPRPPWGSRTPWAEEPWMKAISKLDLRRQAFEDACVDWLTSGSQTA